MPTDVTSAPVHVSTLPPFSNNRALCGRCGRRGEIRVHFDRGCELAHGGDHYHRICRCGHEWLERCGVTKPSEL